jgi:hypothetical protein
MRQKNSKQRQRMNKRNELPKLIHLGRDLSKLRKTRHFQLGKLTHLYFKGMSISSTQIFAQLYCAKTSDDEDMLAEIANNIFFQKINYFGNFLTKKCPEN